VRAYTPAAIGADSHLTGLAGLAGARVLPVVPLVSPKPRVAFPGGQVQDAFRDVLPGGRLQLDVLRELRDETQDGLPALGGFQVVDDRRFAPAPDGAAVAEPVPGEPGSGSWAASVPERGDLR
jgi:hypothetical protein